MEHQPDAPDDLSAGALLDREHPVPQKAPVHRHPPYGGSGRGKVGRGCPDPTHDLGVAVGAMQAMPIAVAPLPQEEALSLDLVERHQSALRVSSTSRAI
jgi:hypothetical protein